MIIKTGIVIKVDSKIAYIMTKSGDFFKVKISESPPKLGAEYSGELINRNNLRRINLKHFASAAAILLVFLFGGAVYAYSKPVATIKLSSNPEIELKTNIFKRVISISPLNSDGAELIGKLKLKNTFIDDAILTLINSTKENTYNSITINIEGREMDTTNLKRNLESKNINFSIESKSPVSDKKPQNSNIKDIKINKSPEKNNKQR